MNTWLKKAISLALAVLMLLLLLPSSLAAEGGIISDPVIPGLSDGGALLHLISGESDGEDAVIEEESCTIEFSIGTEAQEAGIAVPAAMAIAKGSTIEALPTLQWLDENGAVVRAFSGWYLDEEATTRFGMDSAVEHSMTLYAQWSEIQKPLYTLTFEYMWNEAPQYWTVQAEEGTLISAVIGGVMLNSGVMLSQCALLVIGEDGEETLLDPATDAVMGDMHIVVLEGLHDVGLYDISGSKTVEAGSTITLKSDNDWYGYSHTWAVSDPSVATISSNGAQATLTGVALGTVTVYHTYGSRNQTRTETFVVEVTQDGNSGAQVYYLKSPTSNPDSNSTDQWGDVVQFNGANATVNMTGAVWDNNKNAFRRDNNLAQMIVSWPNGSTGASWTLDRNYYLNTVYQAVYDTYRTELEKDLGITDLQLSDIESITLIPYKISKDNGTSPNKHIDCTISVKCSKSYVASFNVQMPGNTDYINVSTQNKKIVNGTPDPIDKYTNNTRIPETMVVDGVTYVFDGWYSEANEKISDGNWPYTPKNAELADGTVNFYAHYVRTHTSVTVTKRVAGNMGDAGKDFTFTVALRDAAGSLITSKPPYMSDADWNVCQNGFTLNGSTNSSLTLSTIPYGATVVITEENTDYTESYAVNDGQSAQGNVCTLDSVTDAASVTFTNTKTASIDTGVNLDMLPYILLLAVAGGAIVLLLALRSRRGKED